MQHAAPSLGAACFVSSGAAGSRRKVPARPSRAIGSSPVASSINKEGCLLWRADAALPSQESCVNDFCQSRTPHCQCAARRR
jgi:hypothetical protein